ncbi:MAG: hypothetical protein RLZZ241_164 [Bacteroidota bacterium]
MKRALLFATLLTALNLSAQDKKEAAVQQAIDQFFEGYHTRDTSMMRAVLGPGALLQSVGQDQEGVPRLQTEDLGNFLKKVASIPDTVQLQEKLLDYRIQLDGNMAHAWTPYHFYLHNAFHHCGVNSFQLFNDGSSWKIIYIVDTRRTNDCRED